MIGLVRQAKNNIKVMLAERKEMKEKDVNKMVTLRKLPSQIGKEKEENKKTEENMLSIGGAKQVLIMFSFMNQENVPFGLREEIDDSVEYNIRRVKETIGTRIVTEEPRKGIIDTGYPMGDYQKCEGGITVFNQLLKKGWKITDAHYKKQQSQGGKQKGSNHIKYKVIVSMSQEGERLKLEDKTFKGIIRLMYRIWAGYAWDNRHLPQKNVVLNFPFQHPAGMKAEDKFVL